MPSPSISVSSSPIETSVSTLENPAFRPRLELVSESLLLDDGSEYDARFRSHDIAALRLRFDYGGCLVDADDPRERIATRRRGAPVSFMRDRQGEEEAKRTLESYGPIELSCFEDCALLPGAHADYAIDLSSDPNALCEFSAHVVPRLRASGWVVEIAKDYPCQLVEGANWYARLDATEEEEGNWFELELGIEVDGKKVDLLPLLIDLLQSTSGESLEFRGTRRFTALPMGDNQYLAVPPARIDGVLKILRELYEVDGIPPGGPLRIPALVPAYLDDLEGVVETVEWGQNEASLRARRRLLPAALTDVVAPPSELKATLRPYQQEGLNWLQQLAETRSGGVLADDMGLGKTLQTIAHICIQKAKPECREPILVVAPTSLVGNWRRELLRFAPHLKVLTMHGPRRHQYRDRLAEADVVLTTYTLVVRDLELFHAQGWHLLILDEAQTIKNARSQAHAALKSLDCELRLALSGTPVENNLGELWSLFDFLMPGFLSDQKSFRGRFQIPIERQRNEERLLQLRKRISPYVLRRMKHEVVRELPPKNEMVRPVEISGEQRDLYESIRIAAHASVRAVVKKKGFAASTVDILGALMKLRQVCCDPRLVSVENARGVEDSAKFDTLMEMVPELLSQGRRILIFSQFTSMLALIAEGLRRQKIDPLCLTGSTPDRQAMVDAFENRRADVFLISLKAGGTGLNLTSADTVIHYDPWWNPAAQNQATDRAYRIGQTRSVFVYNLIVSGSVEERMLNLQRRKQLLSDGLFGKIEQASSLSESDLDDLFSPLSDD